MTKESPIACNVAPFTPDQRARWQALGAEWRMQVSDIRELPDGFALRLPSAAEAILKAAEWMTLDRLCCPFMSFVLEIEAEGGPVWLRLTGREGTKEFMRAAMREAAVLREEDTERAGTSPLNTEHRPGIYRCA